MEYPIIFNLLPENFHCENSGIIPGYIRRELDRRNFRKKIALKGWLEDMDQMEKNVTHRPGKLYSVKRIFRKKNAPIKIDSSLRNKSISEINMIDCFNNCFAEDLK